MKNRGGTSKSRKPEFRIAGEGGASLGPTHPLGSHGAIASSSITGASKVDLRMDVKRGLWRSGGQPRKLPKTSELEEWDAGSHVNKQVPPLRDR